MEAKHGAMYLRVVAQCTCGHGDCEHGRPEQWMLVVQQKEHDIWPCQHKGCDCENFVKQLDKRLKLHKGK
jgi:hypothetical protein